MIKKITEQKQKEINSNDSFPNQQKIKDTEENLELIINSKNSGINNNDGYYSYYTKRNAKRKIIRQKNLAVTDFDNILKNLSKDNKDPKLKEKTQPKEYEKDDVKSDTFVQAVNIIIFIPK